MNIEKLRVENFRSIREADIEFGQITSFVGRNGAGKSTVLYALDAFFNPGALFNEHDYYNHDSQDTDIRICITFTDLRAEEAEEFASYVHNGQLIVTKVINSGGAKYYAAAMQLPEFARVRALKKVTDQRTEISRLIEEGRLPEFPNVPRSGEDLLRAMDEYEAAHPERMELIDQETQFFGPRNVGGGKLDKFTKFVLVPAVRDVSAELQKRGAIMQLIDLIVSRSIDTRQDFMEFKQQFEQRARELYGRDNLPELAELGAMVTARLRRYFPGTSLDLNFNDLDPPAIPLPDAVVRISEDDFLVPVTHSGHGLQRALVLALLEQLATTHFVTGGQGEEGSDEADQAPSVGLILAIEEPELYLHPGRCRFLSRVLRELASGDENLPPVQVAYVTHSPYFVDVSRFDEVRICRKCNDEGEGPRVTSFSSFSRAQAAAALAQVWQADEGVFTPESFVARSSPVLNAIVNEGFFADVAVVVEGDSDAAALWAVQAQLGANWDELGVVVVPAGGKNNIDRIVVSLAGFGIPTYFVFDADTRKTRDNERQKVARTNRALLRMGQAGEQDFPGTTISEQCAVFADDLEAELKLACEDAFEALRAECAEELGHDQPAKCLKNSEVVALFIEKACRAGHRFGVLEEVVGRVGGLSA